MSKTLIKPVNLTAFLKSKFRLHFIFTAWLPGGELTHYRWGVCKYSRLFFAGEDDIPALPSKGICSQLVFPGRPPLQSPGSYLSDAGQEGGTDSEENKVFFCAQLTNWPIHKSHESNLHPQSSWHQPQTNAAYRDKLFPSHVKTNPSAHSGLCTEFNQPRPLYTGPCLS